MIVWLLLGGSGVAAVAHLLIHNPYPIDEVRFLGGAIVHDESHSNSATGSPP